MVLRLTEFSHGKGTIAVDAYKFYHLGNDDVKFHALKPFLEAVAVSLLTNRRAGCPALEVEHMVLRKRARGEEEEEEVAEVHQVSRDGLALHVNGFWSLLGAGPGESLKVGALWWSFHGETCHFLSISLSIGLLIFGLHPQIMSVADWKSSHADVRFEKSEIHAGHGAQARCKVRKCAQQCYFCCVQCSAKEGKVWGVCWPKSGRSCIQLHAVDAVLMD